MTKSTSPTKPSHARRYIRRSDRIEWGRAVACVFAISGLMVLVLVGHGWRSAVNQNETRGDSSPSPATAEEQAELARKARLGRIVSPEGRDCRSMIFDNISGQSRDGGLAACDEQARAAGKYEYPGNRLKSIRERFSKE